MKKIFLYSFLLLALPVPLLQSQELQVARLGDFKLESGEVIRDCVIGYRTFGQLNAEKTNAVLFPTPFGWRSSGLAERIGPGKIVDSTKYLVIAVDSLGDGVSSSPSNSKAQPRLQFPRFSIRDMVAAEHKMLIDTLHIQHLHAVVGFSMGGMQAFQWAVSYPDFMDRVVSILGSPQLTSYDLLLWHAALLSIESDPDWKHGEYTNQPALHLLNMIETLALFTPEYMANQTGRQDYPKFEAGLVQGPEDIDANDTVRQLQAMISHDVTAPFGGSLQRTTAVMRASLLVIVNRQDHLVNPKPAVEFGDLVHGEVLQLDSNCGHRAHRCEMARIGEAVSRFLSSTGGHRE